MNTCLYIIILDNATYILIFYSKSPVSIGSPTIIMLHIPAIHSTMQIGKHTFLVLGQEMDIVYKKLNK